MRHPAYHLRPNKAIDRLMFIGAVRRLRRLADLAEYVYYGLGGPYLEDFRALFEFCPEIRMVSIEDDEETFKRQRFHQPCSTITLERAELRSFVSQYEPVSKSIFWLDYTGLRYGHFEDFMTLVGRVSDGSMIKITLRAEPADFLDRPGDNSGFRWEEFIRQFDVVLPSASVVLPIGGGDFALLLQSMMRVAVQRALPSAMPQTFQLVSSFYYSDGTRMFTLTGVVCKRGEEEKVRGAFRDWPHANLTWARPKNVNVPFLSTKERLRLQKRLPGGRDAGRRLGSELGYLIDEDRRMSELKLRQYAVFHQYYPYFIRGIP